MAKRSSSSPAATRPARIEYAGVVALSTILVITLAGVWQRSGLETIVSQVSCQVQAAVPGGHGTCNTGGSENGGTAHRGGSR